MARPARSLPFPLVIALCACPSSNPGASSSAPNSSTTEATSSGSSTSESGDETGSPSCAAADPTALADCVERERYLADLEFIAAPREPGSAHWQAVQDLCVTRLTALGYEVDLHEYGSGVNVLGRKLGTELPDERILVAAHYDHIPGCNGADDNATGVAATLEAARVLAFADYPRTLLVACWDEEETGLTGSEAYAALDVGQPGELLFNYNFEMIGYYDDAPDSQQVPEGFDLLFPQQIDALAANAYRGDFIALIVDQDGIPYLDPFVAYAQGIGLETLTMPVPTALLDSPLIADLRRSDHAAFWSEGVSAVMMTDTSNFRYANYHCAAGEDAVELLDHDRAAGVVAATVAAAATALGMPG